MRLAGHGAREQRLAGAGRAAQQHAARDASAQPGVAVRVLQEVDDLLELRLGLLDARDVLEGDALRRRLDALGARAAERPERAAGPAARRPAREEDEQRDDQQRRSEADEQRVEEPAALVDRLGLDGDVVVLQQRRELVGVGERRDLGLEAVGRDRAAVARRVVVDALDEAPGDLLALGGDLLDVVLGDLVEEERAVRDGDLRVVVGPQGGRQGGVDGQRGDDEGDPAPADARWARRARGRLRGLGSAAAVRRGGDVPSARIAFHPSRR